ncbi:AT-hook motif nuclear-localized protein 17 [Dichanthelium oligosanthes]|uniref:AT-hook motif nuclear-localized protein n=1 Tax=Dichanthelium oligosanthes TaxID=888268 RepID=A0A1E5W5L9_9POAL|nr:AT-hook motif nuclear-localized protein 17 [Dichanthelium oligosanthes]
MADEGASRAELIEPAPAPALPAEPVTARKPRGRPPGSKNKPKPPVVVTRESEGAMRPVVLELTPGCDVVAAVSAFARRRRVGVSVLCGRGAVAAVTLRLATSPAAASTVTLHGRFEVLSLSGTVLPSPSEGTAPPAPFSVSLAGAGGQVIGGTLAGEMTAADGVVVVAATFGSAEVHRLPAAGAAEDEDGDGRGGGREEGRHHLHSQQQQQQQAATASAGDLVGLGSGYGGAVGLGGGAGSGAGHVGQHAQLAEMALWAQPTSARGPVQHPLPQF